MKALDNQTMTFLMDSTIQLNYLNSILEEYTEMPKLFYFQVRV